MARAQSLRASTTQSGIWILRDRTESPKAAREWRGAEAGGKRPHEDRPLEADREEEVERETGFEPATLSLEG
jgi:hypothetical protein